MPDPIKYFGSYFRGRILSHTVYAKTNWADNWEEKKHVFCTSATWSAAPTMGSAEMYYRYGPGIFPLNDVDRFDWLQPFELPALAFVRIDFEVATLPDNTIQTNNPTITTRSWYGVVGTLVDSFLGSDHEINNGGAITYVRQGVQTLNAIGLEWLLDRQYVNRSWAWNDARNSLVTNRIGYGFNIVANKLAKNRSKFPSASLPNQLSPVFQFDPFGDAGTNAPEYWSSQDIVNYLLAFHMGRGVNDQVTMLWRIEDPNNVIRTDDRPMIASESVRVWQILNQLISRNRGIGFYLRVVDDAIVFNPQVAIELVPFSLSAEDIVLTGPDGQPLENRLPANPNRKVIDTTRDRTCGSISVINDSFSQYDAVEVLGAKAVHCFSLTFQAEGSKTYLEKAWSDTIGTEYETGGELETYFPPPDEIADRQRWSAEFRGRPEYKDVWRRFAITSTEYRDQVYSWTGSPVFPDYDSPDTNPDGINRSVSYSNLIVLPDVPLFADFNYTSLETMAIPDQNIFNEFQRPMVFVNLDSNDDSVSSGSVLAQRWANGESLLLSKDIEAETETQNFHLALHIQAPGIPARFDIAVHGQPQHVLSSDYPWKSWDPEIGHVSLDPDKFLVTIAVEADYRCRVLYYGDSQAPGSDESLLRTRTIFAGDDYRFDLIIEGTVFGVRDGDLRTAQSTFAVRDDRDRLKQIAEVAWVWYGGTRRSIDFQTQFITDALDVGDMITGIVVDRNASGGSSNDVEINTTITSIAITSQVGEQTVSPPVIKYKTEFAELDLVTFFQA